MAREGITFEQVSAAADALVGEGEQPTIRAVRERLGTGSPNTIHRHLTAWREARPAASAAAPELPSAIAAAITAELSRTAAAARAAVEEQLVKTQSEAAELATAGEALEAERDALAEQVGTLTRERDTLSGKAEQQAADLAHQAERIEREQQAAEAARVELATARLRIEAQAERQAEQTATVEHLRAALDAAQAGRVAAEQQAAVLTAKLEGVTAQLAQQDQEAQRAGERLVQVQAERDEARRVAGEAREQAAKLAGQLEVFRTQQPEKVTHARGSKGA